MNNATLNSITLNGIGTTVSSGNFVDFSGCTIKVSDYKWLSKQLKLQQQKFALRPYYECRVVDNDIVFDSILSNSTQPIQGSSVVSPDGKILAVGLDSSNNVGFWKVSDPASLSGAPTVILENVAANRSAYNHYAIQVSDYIAGTYKIDVYFFGNWTAGTYLTIKHYYSLNGGTTWLTAQAVNDTLILRTNTANIWIAAGKPYQDNNGRIISTVFYIEISGSYFDIAYQQYPGTGVTFSTAVHWSTKNVDTNDWVLHSLDVVLIKGKFRIVFSGYHGFFEPTNQDTNIKNYNLYITEIKELNNDETKDVWSPAVSIINALSSSPQNKNSFTLPQLTYDDEKTLFVIFRGITVFSITNDNGVVNVITKDNFYLAQSIDLLNFNYPQPVLASDGTEFQDTNANSFVPLNSYFYILGNGKLWRFIENNIVADVSKDIIAYQIKDTQQSPSTLQLSIGNMNNQWRGASPTESGYKAIANNKKVAIFEGYFLNDTQSETAPKNTFYIDDIQQNVTSNRNDFTISGRDFYKNLKVLTTKFAFNYTGIKKYVDIFDGTTLSNYNVSSGNWIESGNALQQTDSGARFNSVIDSLALFSLYNQSKPNTIWSISAKLPDPTLSLQTILFFFYYVDENNYMYLGVSTNGGGTTYDWFIAKVVAGVQTSLQTGSFSVGVDNNIFPFLFIRESFYKMQIYIGSDVDDGLGIDAFNTGQALGTEVDFSTLFTTGLGSVGFGGSDLNTPPTLVQSFKNFRYQEFDSSQNIEELIQTIATKSGIYDYKMPNVFADYFYDASGYVGTFTLPNRVLTIPPSNTVYRTGSISNADVRFKGKLEPLNTSQDYYFDFIFRNQNSTDTDNNYFIRFANEVGSAGANFISAKLYATNTGTEYLLGGSGGLFGVYKNNLRIDITQWHDFRIIYFGQYTFVLIDDELVFGWYDNNITASQTNGLIAFRTDTNALLKVKDVIAVDLWTQIENYSINPGDDLESSIESLITTIRAYMFSDNLARFKVLKLASSDPSDYIYENQLILQQVDNSDKEYVNQVTVNGLGVTATARDGASISQNGIVRESVINDNKITSYSDALDRANAELVNANKFNNQFNPKQVLNLGSEIYDVITVINTGDNSSNVNQVVRVYSQEIDVGGNNISYWLQLGTGKL